MQCTQAKQQMNELGVKALKDKASISLRQHIDECAHCREYVEDLQFKTLLGQLPIVGPSEGFADRALQQAWQVKDDQNTKPTTAKNWMLATAASVLLAVGLVFTLPEQDTATQGSVAVVAVAPQEVRLVDLLMVSGQAIENAFITLQMDEHVSLEGYPERSTIRWETSIAAGNNQLSLPVQLSGSENGSIVVEVESGGARKQMLLSVEAVPRTEQVAFII